MTVQLEYIYHLLKFLKNIMLSLCLMLSVTQNYAGIIGWSLECIGCLAGHFYKDVGYT